MPCASIIQNRINDPMRGVTIIGKSDKKIVGPLRTGVRRFTPSAINKPRIITNGVTMNV